MTQPTLRKKDSKRKPFDSREHRLSGLRQLNPDINWSEVEVKQKNTLENALTPTSGKNWKEDHEKLLSKIADEKAKNVKK